jgi:MFS family permease
MLTEQRSEPAERREGRTERGTWELGPPDPPVGIETKRPRKGLLRALQNREFALFWGGQAVSQTGTWMQQFAQGWVVTTLAPSAFALASVNLAASIPTLILMPFGGVTADRMERRRILLVTQWAMGVLAVLMGALVLSGRLHLWHIWLIALLLGLATAFDLPAYQSFYPQLVAREDLPQAIALNQATFNGSRIIGPALAAWFVARWGMAAAFFANGASFLAVIGSLLLIRPRTTATRGPSNTRHFMAEGLRYAWKQPRLLALFGITAITTMFVFPNVSILMPFYAKHVLQVGPGALGAIMAVSGAGAFLGAACLLALPRSARIGWIMLALIVNTLSLSLLAWSQSLGLTIVSVAILSLGIASSLGVASTIVQESVEDALRGRVMSLYSLAFTGVMPFAALAIARLADVTGMRRELLLAAMFYGICGLLLLPMLRRTTQKPSADAE